MAIITFINNGQEETGKTLSLVAIATNMAIEDNNRILIVSTTSKRDKIRDCFFGVDETKKVKIGLFSDNKKRIDNENGIEGIAKIVRSNKLTPEIITNYTRVIFKDRLEVILGTEKKFTEDDEITEEDIEEEYFNLINVANMYYDKVFVDLDDNLSEETREKICKISNLIIVSTSQNLTSLEKLKKEKETNEILKSPKSLILIGRYDRYSKYNTKNITRYLEEKNQVLTVPYNTLYFEASNESSVPDLFLRFRRLNDPFDRNTMFIDEVKRTSENIKYRLQELQARI